VSLKGVRTFIDYLLAVIGMTVGVVDRPAT